MSNVSGGFIRSPTDGVHSFNTFSYFIFIVPFIDLCVLSM